MQGIFLNRSGKFTAITFISLKTVSLCLCGRRRRQRREAAFCERLGTKVRKDGEERTILAVTEGQEFLEGIVELIDRMLLECGKISVEEQNRFYSRESIGTCPVCGSPVYESKRNFFCGNRECGFFLWKENRYLSGMKKMIDKKMAAELLKDGRTYVPDLYSQKKGRTFAAYLMLEAADGKAAFRLEFPKKKK